MVIRDRHRRWLRIGKSAIFRHRRVIGMSLGVFFVVVIAVQLFYPAGKGLPFAHIGPLSAALATEASLTEKVQGQFNDASLSIVAGEKTVASPLADAGAELKSETMVARAIEYPLWQRFIPFSIFFHRADLSHLEVTFHDDKLEEYVTKTAAALTAQPVDAGLTIKEGKLEVTQPHDGATVTPEMVRTKIKAAKFAGAKTHLQVKPTKASPKRTMKDIEPVRSQAESYIARGLTITGPNNKSIKVAPADIAAWLSVDVTEGGKVQLVVKDDAVAAYAKGVAKQVDVAPGTVKAKVVDGAEVSRTTAASGLGADQAKLVADLKTAVASSAKEVTIPLAMKPVAPIVQYDRSYTSSRAGLQAYVTYVSQSSNTRIAITQLDGSGWSVGARADEQTVSASTYKVFLSLVLFDKIRSGEVHWSDSIQGYDMATCLEKTIVVSANECAEELLSKFGRTNINNFLYSHGISRATTFTDAGATKTSATDLNRLMIGIYNGSLLSGDDRANLLEKMGRQIYRRGIPAGSKGTVQDKVGFLWDYLNDSGIVHHPKGTYAITILTKGSSWENIAQITRDVEGIMYP